VCVCVYMSGEVGKCMVYSSNKGCNQPVASSVDVESQAIDTTGPRCPCEQ